MGQQSMGAKPRRRTNADLDELQHPLLGDQPTLQLMHPQGRHRCAPVFLPHQSQDNWLLSSLAALNATQGCLSGIDSA